MALQRTNAARSAAMVSELQVRVLYALRTCNGPLRERSIMNDISEPIFRSKFLLAIDKLVTNGYITRDKRKHFVYFSITLEGRSVLDDLNAELIRLVHGK